MEWDRYEVAIPWKEKFPSLPENIEEAEKRLLALEKDRETTKVGILFDSAASCKGVFLNDVMLTEPKLQRDVLEILLRFRLRPVALVADIKEMFCQVLLVEKGRKYQRMSV